MIPHYEDPHLTIWLGDVREALAAMPAESVNCVVTSPPYWGLRDYGIPPSVWGDRSDPLTHVHEWAEQAKRVEQSKSVHWQHTEGGGTRADGSFRNRHANAGDDADDLRTFASVATGFCDCGAWRGCLGLEPTPELFVEHIVEVFREVRRVLRKDGVVWLNLGDSYANDGKWGGSSGGKHVTALHGQTGIGRRKVTSGLKPKDRVMIPARVALALQADGWWLRDEIVWSKPNPMPSSVTDRTTPAHEMVYLLTRAPRYHYDAEAIRERTTGPDDERNRFGARLDVGLPDGKTPDRRRNGARAKVPGGWDVTKGEGGHGSVHREGRTEATYREATLPAVRNKRSVWTVATQPYPEAHFATFPEKLIEPMILAGCPPGGDVLDPFGGSGTVAVVAQRLGRRAVLVDLSAEYVEQMIRRVATARGAGDGPAHDMPVPFAGDGLWAAER